MNTSRKSPAALVLLSISLSASMLLAGPASVSIPLPDGQELSANLEAVDESATNWKLLPIVVEPSDAGFSATVTPAAGTSFPIEGRFEKSGGSIKCSIKWSNAPELDQTFLMLVLVLPVDHASQAELVSGKESISIPKLINNEPARASFQQTSAFTLGPIEGRQLAFDSQSLLDVGVVVMGGKDFVHVRLGLTPRKSPLPTSGEVAWTITQ